MRLISEFKDSVKFVIAAISIVLATYFLLSKTLLYHSYLIRLKHKNSTMFFLNTMIF